MTDQSIKRAQEMAMLSRISLTEEELLEHAARLQKTMNWIASSLDKMPANPDSHNSKISTTQYKESEMRTDEITDGDCLQDVLGSASKTHDPYFVTPQMISEDS